MIRYGSVDEAFAGLDALRERMRQVGTSPDCIELLVVDSERRVVSRPGASVSVDRLPVVEGPGHRTMPRVMKED